MKIATYKDFSIYLVTHKRQDIYWAEIGDRTIYSELGFLHKYGKVVKAIALDNSEIVKYYWSIPKVVIFNSLEDVEEALAKYYDTVRTNINIDIPRTIKEVL